MIASCIESFRAYTDRDDTGEAFAVALRSRWDELALLAHQPDAPPEIWGALEACVDLFSAWMGAEQIVLRSRVALVTTGIHAWDSSVRAASALSSFRVSGYDGRETHWAAHVMTAPDRDALEALLAQLEPAIARGLIGEGIFSWAVDRWLALGHLDEARVAARRLNPVRRGGALRALASYLDEAAQIEEVEHAWIAMADAPLTVHLQTYIDLVRLHPRPRARLLELDARVAELAETDLAFCPEHDDARILLGEAWERAGDPERATRWRERIPPAEPVIDDEDDAPASDDPRDLEARVANASIGELETWLARAKERAPLAPSHDAWAWRAVIAAVALRAELPERLARDAKVAMFALWDVNDDLPPALDRRDTEALLRVSLRRRRRAYLMKPAEELRHAMAERPLHASPLSLDGLRARWIALRGPEGSSALVAAFPDHTRREIVAALGGEPALAAWASLATLVLES